MADKDDVLSLFGDDTLDEGNDENENDVVENDNVLDSSVDVVTEERNLRSKNKPVRGRGRGRASSLSMARTKADRGFKRPASASSVPDIKKLRQQLGLNRLENSMNTLSNILVERSTEGRSISRGRGCTRYTKSKPTVGYSEAPMNFHTPVNVPFALGAPEQDQEYYESGDYDNNMVHDDLSYDHDGLVYDNDEEGTGSLYEPEETLGGFWQNEEPEEVWNIPQNEDEDKTGPHISPSLATAVDRACTRKIDKAKLDEITGKYLRPGNCQYLKAPRVNPTVWFQVPNRAQSYDSGLQDIQKLLASGMVPLFRLAEMIATFPGEVRDKQAACKTFISDAVAIFGNAFYTASMRRRFALRPFIREKFKNICSQDQPVTNWLFGDDIDKKIKEISEISKVSIGNNQSFGFSRRQRGPLNFQRRPSGRGQFRGRGRRYHRYFNYPRQNGRGTAKDKAQAQTQAQ